MDNLDHLINIPSGCGEENMVNFAPLASVSKYLQETGQFNAKIKEKAKNAFRIGKFQKCFQKFKL